MSISYVYGGIVIPDWRKAMKEKMGALLIKGGGSQNCLKEIVDGYWPSNIKVRVKWRN